MNPEAMDVHLLASGEEEIWEQFVALCPEATFFHRVGWKQITEKVFGHQTYYLWARSSEGVRGVLPLVHVRSRLFGNALVSTPFCVYGGVAALDEAARLALESRAETLARDLKVGWLECRNSLPRRAEWAGKPFYFTFRKRIEPNPEANLLAIPRKQRAEVRRGAQNGLISLLDNHVDGQCFDVYSESVRNLGTPVFPRALFRALKETFGDDCEGLRIEQNGKTVSSVVSFYFRDQVLPYYGGGVREARALGAMAFMYWELMTRAADRGARVFDFGRSKQGSGSFDFKKYYGFTPEPLHYRYCLVQAKSLPEINTMNPKYQMFIRLWKHLPLPVAERLGPLLSRHLG
ncbi:MAG: FemAB family PEP-CTERM system-associated protein [Magnetococcales bacterium]|nr:FemAB family PEP-CTERM system-associated protein [Magnetococcales bacterium]MBF0438157.1 FemAB family PEP-CTERM system-associated protein [Magnetococcales bacterium]